jgi:hypothetical protein
MFAGSTPVSSHDVVVVGVSASHADDYERSGKAEVTWRHLVGNKWLITTGLALEPVEQETLQ